MEHELCQACGFDGSLLDATSLLNEIRDLGPRWSLLLESGGEYLQQRPSVEVWSALEYACHSRDITTLHVYGVQQAIEHSEPKFPDIDTNIIESAASEYNDSDPTVVSQELTTQTGLLASVSEGTGVENWVRGLTVGTERMDIRRLLEHALHDSQHHLLDVARGYEQVSSSS